MLETTQNQSFNFQVLDSTVYVNPGLARVGNTLLPFRGDHVALSSMADFGDATDMYQYSTLLLRNLNSWADLTSAVSSPEDATAKLSFPIFTTDSSNPYAPVFPIGMFLFYTPDGTNLELLSSQKAI